MFVCETTTRRLVSSPPSCVSAGSGTSVFVPPTLVLLFSSPKLAWKENDLLIRLLWLVSPATLRSLANCVRINPKQGLVPGECCWFLPTKLFTTRRHKRWLSKTSKKPPKTGNHNPAFLKSLTTEMIYLHGAENPGWVKGSFCGSWPRVPANPTKVGA